MADIINSVDRSLDMYIYDLYIYIYIDISLLCEPNDAVRAVAVAKRREYISPCSHHLEFTSMCHFIRADLVNH